MLVHGDLKLVLWPVLTVEGRRMVIEVHHTDCDCRNGVVEQLIVWSNFRRLVFNNDTLLVTY